MLGTAVSPRVVSFLKLAFAVGLLAALIHYFRLEEFIEALHSLDGYLISLAVVAVCLQLVLAAGRWWLLLTGYGWRHVSFMESLSVNIVGASFQYWTPGGVALDAVRILSSRKNEIPKKLLLFLTLLDRVLVVACVAVFAVVFFLLRGIPASLTELSLPRLFWLFVVTGGAIGLGAILIYLRRRPVAIPRNSNLSPWRLVLAAALALLTVANFGLSAFLISVALAIPSDLVLFLLLFPVAVLMASLPLTPGGFGVREISTVFILGPYLPAGDAKLVLISFLFGAISVLVTVPGALYFIFSRKHSVI